MTQSGAVYIRQQAVTGGSALVGGRIINSNPSNGRGETTRTAFVELRQPLLEGGRVFVARRFISDAEYDLEIEEAQLAAEIGRASGRERV